VRVELGVESRVELGVEFGVDGSEFRTCKLGHRIQNDIIWDIELGMSESETKKLWHRI
jgi:hypothetical protein